MNIRQFWLKVRELEATLPETVVLASWQGDPVRANRRQAAEAIVSGRMRMGTREEGDILRRRDELHATLTRSKEVAARKGFLVVVGKPGETKNVSK